MLCKGVTELEDLLKEKLGEGQTVVNFGLHHKMHQAVGLLSPIVLFAQQLHEGLRWFINCLQVRGVQIYW